MTLVTFAVLLMFNMTGTISISASLSLTVVFSLQNTVAWLVTLPIEVVFTRALIQSLTLELLAILEIVQPICVKSAVGPFSTLTVTSAL